MRTLTTISLIIVLAGMAQPAQFRKRGHDLREVSVRDADFRVVKVLTREELIAFQMIWKNKKEVKVSLSEVGGEHFKIDVEHQDRGARWLYHTTGYIQMLSKSVKPVYKLQDPEPFNRLIGATK